jgi:hypothetical protein
MRGIRTFVETLEADQVIPVEPELEHDDAEIALRGLVEMGGAPPEYKVEMGAVPKGFRVEMGGK